jgi:hypothetical protein
LGGNAKVEEVFLLGWVWWEGVVKWGEWCWVGDDGF